MAKRKQQKTKTPREKKKARRDVEVTLNDVPDAAHSSILKFLDVKDLVKVREVNNELHYQTEEHADGDWYAFVTENSKAAQCDFCGSLTIDVWECDKCERHACEDCYHDKLTYEGLDDMICYDCIDNQHGIECMINDLTFL